MSKKVSRGNTSDLIGLWNNRSNDEKSSGGGNFLTVQNSGQLIVPKKCLLKKKLKC
jgi:hypothetical protein